MTTSMTMTRSGRLTMEFHSKLKESRDNDDDWIKMLD
jgi:hypothetical protein